MYGVHFGFSYIGLLYLLMLFVPNIIWSRHQPVDYDKYVVRENRILAALERIGEALVCTVALIFSDFNIGSIRPWSLMLAASFALLILYEIYWIRYFRSEKRMQDFYSSLWGIPLAGATLPVAAFFLLGIYGRNPLLIMAVVILGIGHIGIHMGHAREIRQ